MKVTKYVVGFCAPPGAAGHVLRTLRVLFSDIRSFEKRYALEAEGAAPRVPAGDEGLLEEMLKDGKQRKQLRKTAKSQHCEELLAFVDAFMELKYHSTDAEDRLILAERLFTRFLRVGCSKEINLSHAVRVPLEALGAKLQRSLIADCSADEFEAAYQEVRDMIATSVWPTFKQARDAPKKGLLGGLFK